MHVPAALLAAVSLAGCAELAAELGLSQEPAAPAGLEEGAAPDEAVIQTSVTAPPPRPTARTVEEFDTTSAEDRAAAVASAGSAASEQRLGTTIASLGSPTDPGIWMSTPHVSEVTMGRVEYPVTGKSVTLELRPSGGVPGSGSQISLAAMRLLDAPLTALPELVVYR
jgi:hypothetical protein